MTDQVGNLIFRTIGRKVIKEDIQRSSDRQEENQEKYYRTNKRKKFQGETCQNVSGQEKIIRT